MKKKLLEQISQLRIAAGYMMEKQSWWNTSFFSDTAKDFLSFPFPKSINRNTSFYLEPIRYLIDEEVGANYYHLYRLPVEIEEQLHKTNFTDEKLIESEEAALEILQQLSEGLSVDTSQGPVNIGASDNLNRDTIQAFAGHYYNAFKNNYKVHPYLN